MRHGHWIVAAVVGLVALPTPARALDPAKETPQEVKKAVADGKAVLVDVREKEEWDAGHLKDAKSLPLSDLQDGIKPDELARVVPKDKVVYCYCAAGKRSLAAAELLKKQGYDARPLKPGFNALVKAGLEPAVR